MTNSQLGRRNDPSIKKMLMAIYLLYFLGAIESLLLPTNGIFMVFGFSFILFQYNAIKESSFLSHYRWLIVCAVVLLFFSFFNVTFPIHIETIQLKFQSKYIGQIIYFFLVAYGFFYLLNNKQLPFKKNKEKFPSRKR